MKLEKKATLARRMNRQKRRETRLALRRLLYENERPGYPLPEPPLLKPLG